MQTASYTDKQKQTHTHTHTLTQRNNPTHFFPQVKSKPMIKILEQLVSFSIFDIIVLSEKVMLGDPVEAWPVCDALITYHSHGYDFDKVFGVADKIAFPFSP